MVTKLTGSFAFFLLIVLFTDGAFAQIYPFRGTISPSINKVTLPTMPNFQAKIELVRQNWCRIINEGEHDEYCQNPTTGIEFSEEYRIVCGNEPTTVCREALGLTVEKCPTWTYRLGGC